MFKKRKKVYYKREFSEVKEGGVSRDLAFYNHILNNNEYEIRIVRNEDFFFKKNI